jgi:hypothetical protein
MKPLARAILSTLYYHQLFYFPLNLANLKKWLFGYHLSSLETDNQLLAALETLVRQRLIDHNKGYYYLKNCPFDQSSMTMKRKTAWSKVDQAQKVCRLIGWLPWVRLVAVTGNVAMDNTNLGDDVDLMIVTQPQRLWLSRLLIVLGLKFIGQYRSTQPSSRIDQSRQYCLNLWLESVQPLAKNAFVAHELLAIKPLINKKGAYERLIQANKWVFDFWPNHPAALNLKTKLTADFKYNRTLNRLNELAYHGQRLYMRRKITREKIAYQWAFFHPQDQSRRVLRLFDRYLAKL